MLMKRRSVGLGGLALMLLLTLAAIGLGFALWSKVLTINGIVRTGTLNDEFVAVFTDDDDAVDDPAKDSEDTGDCLVVVGPETPPLPFLDKRTAAGTSCDPAATGRDPKQHYDKDVARCDAVALKDGEDNEPQPGSQAALVRMDNVYPSYHCTAWFDLHNNGTIPELLHSVKVEGANVAPCIAGVAPTPFDLSGGGGPDLEICVSGLDCAVTATGFDCKEPQIDPGQVFQLDLDMHVMQTAPQGATFGFKAEVCKHQWNEEIGVCPAPGTPPGFDFGDAPEDDEFLFAGSTGCTGVVTHYPSRLASSGPYHSDFTDVWLGDHPNSETAEPDAILPNCDDWIAPPFDLDDGCLILDIAGSGWACIDGDGGAVFGPFPGTEDVSCELALWLFEVSVGAGAPAVPRFANVVVDDRCPGPDGFYGEVAAEHVMINEPVVALPGGTETKVTLTPFFVEVFCDDFITPPPAAAPFTDCSTGTDSDGDGGVDEWGLLPFWTRFMVSRSMVPFPWDGTGPAGGFVYGETEDWLVFGDPSGQERPDLVIDFGGVTQGSGECLVRYTVRNIGAGGAGPSLTHVELFGEPALQAPAPALPPAGVFNTQTSVPWPPLLPCGNAGRLTADISNAVAETNEGNNTTNFP